MKELTVEQRIKREETRLKRVFKDIDKNKLTVVEGLIHNAAWSRITLDDLQRQITAEGVTAEYQNGENQKGTRQSDATRSHISITKNYTAIIKLLTELAPAEKKKESRLQALRDE